jgi:exodeoxyribonuclease V beta subunit
LLESLDFPAARGEALDRAVAGQLARFGFGPEWQGVVAAAVGDLLDTPLDSEYSRPLGAAHARQPEGEGLRLQGVDRTRESKGEGLRLREIDRARRLDELEFWYPLAGLTAADLEGTLARFSDYRSEGPRLTFSPVRGLMHGYLDLVFEWNGRYYLADYKSNHLGGRVEDYTRERLAAAMAEHRYDLQYLVYTVALHRFLATRLPDYDYERHFGGAYYLFLRGLRAQAGPAHGVFFDRPPRALVEALDALLAGRSR